MNEARNRPAWQLPPGVSRGTWDYVQSEPIAVEYDQFHAGHPLLELDRQLVLDIARTYKVSKEQETLRALDLGCGTGRVMMPLARTGWQVLGVDLSQSMLEQVQAKWSGGEVETRESHGGGDVFGALGNLAQLEFLETSAFDLAYCLYSSIGMVQGRLNRVGMMREVGRSLKKEGRLIVHVHNRGTWWSDPGGVKRCLSDWWRSFRESRKGRGLQNSRDPRWQYGDRVYAYRGLPSMYLHIFSARELKADLRASGFKLERWIVLNRTSSGSLRPRIWFPHFRAGGYIAVAKPAD
jgi:SAM-dependent methyltransferase